MKIVNPRYKVSIICNTYNQKDYIEDAIESFLRQKCKFSYVILIHDDASTDGTTSIIKKYSNKFPDIIKPIFQESNQYSKGISIIDKYQYPRVCSEYVAFCEGDDYWIDEYKLQKQVEFLDTHQNIDICAHAANIANAKTKKVVGKISPSNTDRTFSIEEVIIGGGGFVSTNSLLYRSSLISILPEFRKYLNLDYALQINGSLRGGMGYLADTMSTYRVFSNESWSIRMLCNPDKHVSLLMRIVRMLNILDIETDGRYHDSIKKAIIEQEMQIVEIDRKYIYRLERDYDDYKKYINNKRYIKFLLKVYMPFLHKIYSKILYGY